MAIDTRLPLDRILTVEEKVERLESEGSAMAVVPIWLMRSMLTELREQKTISHLQARSLWDRFVLDMKEAYAQHPRIWDWMDHRLSEASQGIGSPYRPTYRR